MLRGCDPARTLVVVDPFDVTDWTAVAVSVRPAMWSLWFAATPEDRSWSSFVDSPVKPRTTYDVTEWIWYGHAELWQPSGYHFVLLAAMPTDEQIVKFLFRLSDEHALLEDLPMTYGYQGRVYLLI